MSQAQICDNCGAKIEIEDTDALQINNNEVLVEENENPKENILCASCTHQAMSDKNRGG